IDTVRVLRRSKVRKAKLYYIRKKSAKDIRKKMKGLAAFVPVAVVREAISAMEVKEEAVETKGTKE
ncbi:MAG TPA: 50S ribosomal protein L19, partial [Candidatus Paceibacterota bacterium]